VEGSWHEWDEPPASAGLRMSLSLWNCGGQFAAMAETGCQLNRSYRGGDVAGPAGQRKAGAGGLQSATRCDYDSAFSPHRTTQKNSIFVVLC